MKRASDIRTVIAAAGTIVPQAEKDNAGNGIINIIQALKLMLVKSVSNSVMSKEPWRREGIAGHRKRAAIPIIKKDASVCIAIAVTIGKNPEKK